MNCAVCKYPETAVVRTENGSHPSKVFRRRECLKCGHRFSTEEDLRSTYHNPSKFLNPPTRTK